MKRSLGLASLALFTMLISGACPEIDGNAKKPPDASEDVVAEFWAGSEEGHEFLITAHFARGSTESREDARWDSVLTVSDDEGNITYEEEIERIYQVYRVPLVFTHSEGGAKLAEYERLGDLIVVENGTGQSTIYRLKPDGKLSTCVYAMSFDPHPLSFVDVDHDSVMEILVNLDCLWRWSDNPLNQPMIMVSGTQVDLPESLRTAENLLIVIDPTATLGKEVRFCRLQLKEELAE